MANTEETNPQPRSFPVHQEVLDSKLNGDGPEDFHDPSDQKSFCPEGYLKCFYTDVEYEPAMKVVLLIMPNIAYRLPDGLETMLDVGSGPTIHMPMIFRNKVKRIYLSDYSEDNTRALQLWRDSKGIFDWTTVIRYLAMVECASEHPETMEADTKAKVAGVFRCDCFNPQLLIDGPFSDIDPVTTQFDVVSTVFCIEAACTTETAFRNGLRNVFGKVRPGGFIILGIVLEMPYYQYNFERYCSYYLTEEKLFEALAENGVDAEDPKTIYRNHEGIVIIMAQTNDQRKTDSD